MTPHEILGLTDAADEPQIRKAYAAALKRTRPEDDAAAFQRLHEAYRAAMRQQAWCVAALAVEATADDDDDLGESEAFDHQTDEAHYDWEDWDEPLAWTEGPVPALDEAGQACVDAVVAAAASKWPKQLEAWLLQYDPLYPPDRKQQVTIPLLLRLLEVVDRLDPRTVEAIVAFFGMDELGVVPYRYQDAVWHLRLRARFDYPQFEADLLRRCRPDVSTFSLGPSALECWLEGYHPLDDYRMRDHAGDRLHARLLADDVPALNPQFLEIVCRFFGYTDTARLLDRHRALWAIESGRAWDYDVWIRRPLRQLTRPWNPWRAVLHEVFHSDAKVIAKLGRSMSVGFDGVPRGIDPRQYAFFARLADPRYLGLWRWLLIAAKGAAWGVHCLLFTLLVYRQVFPNLLVFFPVARIVLGTSVAFWRALLAPTSRGPTNLAPPTPPPSTP